MSIEVTPRDLYEHIEKVLSLLKMQKYIPQATALTTEERKKLCDAVYKEYGSFGNEEYKWGVLLHIKTQEEIDNINKEIYKNMDEETRAIVLKCGVDPKKIFHMGEGYCEIDERFLFSMKAYSIANIGPYTIKMTRTHPVVRNSDEINSFIEKVREEKYERFKDGGSEFDVLCEIDGRMQSIYQHIENLHWEDFVYFKKATICGTTFIGANPFAGIMRVEESRANCINELMPFFIEFESLLSNEIAYVFSNSNVEAGQKKIKTL